MFHLNSKFTDRPRRSTVLIGVEQTLFVCNFTWNTRTKPEHFVLEQSIMKISKVCWYNSEATNHYNKYTWVQFAFFLQLETDILLLLLIIPYLEGYFFHVGTNKGTLSFDNQRYYNNTTFWIQNPFILHEIVFLYVKIWSKYYGKNKV